MIINVVLTDAALIIISFTGNQQEQPPPVLVVRTVMRVKIAVIVSIVPKTAVSAVSANSGILFWKLQL